MQLKQNRCRVMHLLTNPVREHGMLLVNVFIFETNADDLILNTSSFVIQIDAFRVDQTNMPARTKTQLPSP